MKRWSTVQAFITSGKAPASETVASFEGFASKGDGGASLWIRTGLTGTASQSPINRGDNLLNDSSGVEWKPTQGTTIYFDGTNQWLPSPFGDSGAGLYQFNGSGWNYYEQAGGAVSLSTTVGLIANSFNYDVGTALSFVGYSVAGDGGEAQWVKTSGTGTPSQSPSMRGDGTLTDANGAVWEVSNKSEVDIRAFGASTSGGDNASAILACHGAADDGATLTIPAGEFLTSALVFTKKLNIILNGTLKRSESTTDTDSVLEIAGDESSLTGGGEVSWNVGVGSDTGRGEAIRITGDRVYASNITGSDTDTGTGNGWYVEGSNCELSACKARNCSYAGVRTNMFDNDDNGEPTGVCTIKDFVAEDCRRGWVNNRDAEHIYIDNFQIVNPKSDADVQLLGETGDDIKFKNLTITNTVIRQQVAEGSNIVKFVGVQNVNLTNCTFDTDGATDVTPLRLQNEHAGTDTYQVNKLSMCNVKLVATGTEVINVDAENQWRIESVSCRYTLVDGTGVVDMFDLAETSYWVSTDDEFVNVDTACENLIRMVDIQTGATARYLTIVRPRILGPQIQHIFRFTVSTPDVGQVSCIDPYFENAPAVAGYLTGSNSEEAKIRIGGGSQHDRQFSCLLTEANALDPADYQSGDRVYVRNPTDAAKVVRVKAATVWNDS
jgi:hypothetical protein